MNKSTTLLIVIAIVAIIVGVFLKASRGDIVGSASPGIPAVVATTSVATIGPNNRVLIFNANPTCSARVITTREKAVMLSFSAAASSSLTLAIGHLQGASTTIYYPAESFGCDQVNAMGYDASTTIITTETR